MKDIQDCEEILIKKEKEKNIIAATIQYLRNLKLNQAEMSEMLHCFTQSKAKGDSQN